MILGPILSFVGGFGLGWFGSTAVLYHNPRLWWPAGLSATVMVTGWIL